METPMLKTLYGISENGKQGRGLKRGDIKFFERFGDAPVPLPRDGFIPQAASRQVFSSGLLRRRPTPGLPRPH